MQGDFSLHQLHQSFYYGQTKTGPAVVLRYAFVFLRKAVENLCLTIGGYAFAGIGDKEGDACLRDFSNAESDFSLIGKFDGIVEQVGEDLREPVFVALHQHILRQKFCAQLNLTFLHIYQTFLIKDVERVEGVRSEEHTSELQSRPHLVCRLLLEKK